MSVAEKIRRFAFGVLGKGSKGRRTKYGDQMKEIKIEFKTEIKMVPLYKKQINDRVEVSICQEQKTGIFEYRENYLSLVLRDLLLGREIHLKLSTFRKIVKWVEKMGFMKARRLTDREIRKLNRSA